jgi:hypothetical protein
VTDHYYSIEATDWMWFDGLTINGVYHAEPGDGTNTNGLIYYWRTGGAGFNFGEYNTSFPGAHDNDVDGKVGDIGNSIQFGPIAGPATVTIHTKIHASKGAVAYTVYEIDGTTGVAANLVGTVTTSAVSGTDFTFEVDPVPPIPEVVFTVNDVEFRDIADWGIRVELNDTGSGFMTIHRSHPDATEANLQQGNIVKVTIPEIDPDPIFEFLLETGDFQLLETGEEGKELLTFGGAGTLAILRRAIIHPEAYLYTDQPTNANYPEKGYWEWGNQEAGDVIRRFVEEAQERGILSDVTLSFDLHNDTSGAPWELIGHWRAQIGTNLYDEVMRLVAAGILQIEMAPGLVLNAWEEVGTDRTSTSFAAGKVRFVKGVNIATEMGKQMPGREYASDAIVRKSDNTYVLRSITPDPYPAEVYVEVNSKSTSTAEKAGDRALGVRSEAQDSILFEHRVPWPGDEPDDESGIYLPGQEWTERGRYWVGDLVTLHTGTGEFDFDNETFRVVAINLRPDSTGYVIPSVELGAPWGSTSGDTSGSVGGTTGEGSVGSGSSSAPVDLSPYQLEDQLRWKHPVRVATTGNVTISTALNEGDTIDGETLVAGDRVLVRAQTDESENGIYQAGATPSRTSDFDGPTEVAGAVVVVLEGTANAGTAWRCENADEPDIGTDDITFAAFGGGGSGPLSNYTATADPTATDDDGDGYEVGSRWVNTSSGEEFVCVDASTGAAVWTSTTAGGGSGSITVEESDGSPSVNPVDTIKFHVDDFDVTDNADGSVTVTTNEPDAAAHVSDSSDAHDASAISYDPSTSGLSATDAQAAIDELAAAGGGGGGVTVKDEGSALSTTATTLDFVGAGVTASGTGATKTITIPGGGASGPPLDQYTLDGTYGDHFTGASLDAKWTRRNFTGGAESYQLGKNATWLGISTSGRAVGDGYFQSAPSGDWTFAMKSIHRGTRYASMGLACIDSSGNGVSIVVYSNPAGPILVKTTTYSTYASVFAVPNVAGTSPTVHVWPSADDLALDRPLWLSLRKSGTNFYVAYSLDGEMWSAESDALSYSFTVDRIGFMIAPLSSVNSAHKRAIEIDWFNKIA